MTIQGSEIAAFDEPSEVKAVDGEVVWSGPGGMSLSLTPSAARESGIRLLSAADQAELFFPED